MLLTTNHLPYQGNPWAHMLTNPLRRRKEANRGKINITTGLVVTSKVWEMEENKSGGIIIRIREEVVGCVNYMWGVVEVLNSIQTWSVKTSKYWFTRIGIIWRGCWKMGGWKFSGLPKKARCIIHNWWGYCWLIRWNIW